MLLVCLADRTAVHCQHIAKRHLRSSGVDVFFDDLLLYFLSKSERRSLPSLCGPLSGRVIQRALRC